MKNLRSTFTYANVVATLALFLALGGGAVYAAGTLGKNSVKSTNIARNAVKSRNIAANAVKARNLAKNSVTAAKVKPGTLTRTQLAAGTLAGLEVADAQASTVPGLATKSPSGGTPLTLTGTTSFTPAAGKSYELLTELKGNPTDADGTGGFGECYAWVQIEVNGQPIGYASIWANASSEPPFNLQSVGTSSAAVGLLEAGQPQTLTAHVFGSSGCGASTTGSLRTVVVELG